MQASLPREKWRGFFLKIYFRRNCSRDNNLFQQQYFQQQQFCSSNNILNVFQTLKNRDAS